VKYVGKVKGLGAGYWLGIVLDEPVGDSDGKVAGK
jgi:dynactin complex subunit